MHDAASTQMAPPCCLTTTRATESPPRAATSRLSGIRVLAFHTDESVSLSMRLVSLPQAKRFLLLVDHGPASPETFLAAVRACRHARPRPACRDVESM